MIKTNVKHNHLIEEIVNSPLFRIYKNGTIMTRISRTGKVFCGNVWRKAGWEKSNKYRFITYKYKGIAIHRIIYRKFHGPLYDHLVINHKDGNPCNNNYKNLELVTLSENSLHSFRVLKNPPSFGNAGINKKIADKIRKDYKHVRSYRKLGYKYNMSKTNIAYIIQGRIWK